MINKEIIYISGACYFAVDSRIRGNDNELLSILIS